MRPQQLLSAEAGSHRFLWDLHYTPLDIPPSYPIAAIYKNTAPNPTSPWVMPGDYVIRLTVDGNTSSLPIKVKMDPRVKTSISDLQKQHDLSFQAYQAIRRTIELQDTLHRLRLVLKELLTKASGTLLDSLKEMDQQLAVFENSPGRDQDQSIGRMNSAFNSLFNILHDTDIPPTTQAIEAATEGRR